MSSMLLAVSLLADGENKKSGPIGLAVILALCVICYFLFKSMSRHLRKVREEFPDDGSTTPPGPNSPTDAESPTESTPEAPTAREPDS